MSDPFTPDEPLAEGAPGTPLAIDTDGDGSADLVAADPTGDGQADWLATTDESGATTVVADTDGRAGWDTMTSDADSDGRPEVLVRDLDADGLADLAQLDLNSDGFLETTSLADGTVLQTDPTSGVVTILQPGTPVAPDQGIPVIAPTDQVQVPWQTPVISPAPTATPQPAPAPAPTLQPAPAPAPAPVQPAPTATDDGLIFVGPDGSRTTFPGIDSNADGTNDAVTIDLDGDRRDETILGDTNRDGVLDTMVVDVDGDGTPDAVFIDESQTGQWVDVTEQVIGQPAPAPAPVEPAPAPAPVEPAPAPAPVEPAPAPTTTNETLVFIAPDGTPTALPAIDSNADGIGDAVIVDLDGDGRQETILGDTNSDQILDTMVVDENADGTPDAVFVDPNQTGAWTDVTEQVLGQPAPAPAPVEQPAPDPAPAPVEPAPAPAPAPVEPAPTATDDGLIFVGPDGTRTTFPGIDSNADGTNDAVTVDLDGDGRQETILGDTNSDQILDTMVVDENADGTPDAVFVDPNQSGQWTDVTEQVTGQPAPAPAPVEPAPAPGATYESAFPEPVLTGNPSVDLFATQVWNMDRQAEELWHDTTGKPVPLGPDGRPINGARIYTELMNYTTDPAVQKQLAELADQYMKSISTMLF